MNHCQILKRENYFDQITSQNQAYLLGLLFADGCNTRKGFSVVFHEQDRYALDWFIQEIVIGNRTPKLSRSGQSKAFALHLISKQLSEGLTKQGCVPRKSWERCGLPKINRDLWPHFIRGLFDGDGCAIKSKKYNSLTISLLGDRFLLEEIVKLLKNSQIFSKIYPTHSPHCYEIKFAERESVRIFHQWIYNEAIYFFPRKRDIIQNYLNGVPQKSKMKGIGYCQKRKRWYASIWHNQKTVNLGRFSTEKEAFQARIQYEKENNLDRRHRFNFDNQNTKIS